MGLLRRTEEITTTHSAGPGRKFAAFVMSLVTIVVCAYLHLDVSGSIVGLFSAYCVVNSAQKVGMSWSEHRSRRDDE